MCDFRCLLAFACVLAQVALVCAQDAFPVLIKKLDSDKSAERFDALMELAEHGPRAAAATDRLIAILSGFDEEERTLATVVLGKIGKPALPAIEKLLGREDDAVRYNAVWALGLAGPDAKANVPRLLKIAETDSEDDVRRKAIFALARISPDAATLKALAGAVEKPGTASSVRLTFLEELRGWGEPAIDPLGRALKDDATYETAQQSLRHVLEKHKTKSAAAAMLPYVEIAYLQAKAHANLPPWRRPGRSPLAPAPVISDLCDSDGMGFVIATLGDQVIAPLAKKLHGQDAGARAAACDVLGNIGRTLRACGEAPDLVDRIVTLLLPLLKHADPATRAAVAASLPNTKAAAPALRAALLDDDAAVCRAAYQNLGAARFDAFTERREQFTIAKGDEKVRLACALVLMQYDRDALAFLWKFLDQPKQGLQHRAAYVIGLHHATENAGDMKKKVIPVLVESLKADDAARRGQAAEALSVAMWHSDGAHVATLVAALKDKDARVRQHVIAALRTQAREGRNDILPAVAPFLRDRDPQTRIYAIHCFGNSGKIGVDPLLKLLEMEKERVVRNQLLTSMQQPDVPKAVEALFKALENEEDWKHAADALWRVGEKKTFPRTLAILRKKDRAIELTFAEIKTPPATIVGAVQALVPLFSRDDLAVNRRALHTLDTLSVILWDDTKLWLMPLEQSFERRLKELKPALAARDDASRREAVAFLAELRALRARMYFHITSRTHGQDRPPMEELWHKNQQTIDDLLNLARRDEQLSIRRAARKAMTNLALDQSR